MSNEAQKVNSVVMLKDDLCRRYASPVRSVTFYCCLGFAIIGGGGIGIWYAIVSCYLKSEWNLYNISSALFTYFPALVASALFEINQERQPYLRSFGLLSVVFFVFIFVISVITTEIPQLVWSIVGSFLAVMFWWAANGEKDLFKDIDPSSSTGGDINQPLLKGEDQGSNWQK